MRLTALITVCLFPPLTLFAATQSPIKPGLWSVTLQMQMAGMPEFSDEDLAQLEQFGIQLPFKPGKAMVVQQCVTPEQATLENPIDHYTRPEDACKVNNYQKRGNQVSGNIVCTGEIKAQGNFEMTINSDTQFSGRGALQGETREGIPINQATQVQGKWVQSACDPSQTSPLH